LIGGSVGLAARRSGWDVVGVDNPEVLEEAVSLGAIDRPSTLKETRGADLVVLAAPISRVTDLVAELPPTKRRPCSSASRTRGPTSSRAPATSSPPRTRPIRRLTARSRGS
jgi:prephenate dehydrogenase